MSTATAAHLAESNGKPPLQAPKARQFLSFRVGEQEYAVDILRVQEIRGQTPITPLPQVQKWVRGAMNLRGVIVPVVDLRNRFGEGVGDYHRFSVIIVVSSGPRQVGLLVDAVNDVVEFGEADTEPAPTLSTNNAASFLEGIGRRDERLLLLLNLENVIN